MASGLLEPYVALDVRRSAQGQIRFDYVDSAGRQIADCSPDDAGLISALRDWTDKALPQMGPYSTGVSPVAVFVRALDGDERSEDLLRDVEEALVVHGIDGDAIQLVVRTARANAERLPFRLPLEIAAVGSAAPLIDTVRQQSWATDPEVQQYGLTFSTPKRLPQSHQNDLPDIIILTEPATAEALSAWDEDRRPRLVIAVGFIPSLSTAHRSSHAWIVFPDHASATQAAIEDIVFEIVHDRPLHSVLKSLIRRISPQPRAFLIADPASIDDLRMWDALVGVAEEIRSIETQMPSPQTSSWLDTVGLLSRAVKSIAFDMTTMLAGSSAAVESLRDLRGSIGRESDALVPASRARARLAEAGSKVAEFEQRMATAVRNPAVAAAIENAPRRVDVALMRTDPRTRWTIFVDETESLTAGARYRLRVHIGRRSASSIIKGDVPAIDPLLPPPPEPAGHLLHVVVYPLDFGGEPQMQRLRLAPGRTSEPIYFDVFAPSKPMNQARLRIAVYYDAGDSEATDPDHYRNQLVQSFLLVAQVDELENWRGEGTTTVSLEFSRTKSFTNVDAFGARALSIAVNESPGGTHKLMLKRGGSAAVLAVSQQFLQEQMTEVRDALWKASSADGKTPRFPTGSIGDEGAFDDAVRDLACKGYDLRQRFFGSDDGSGTVQSVFKDIRKSPDIVVQVTRLEQDFYFPWALLYDFAVPPKITGAPAAEVCKGFLRTNEDKTPFTAERCMKECLHPDKKEAFCVYGFWGLRLQLEQTLDRLKKEDDTVPLLSPIGDGCVLVATALGTATALAFAGDLRSEIGKDLVAEMTATDKLLTRLWASDRPSIVIVLGHYQTKPITGQRDAPRIAIPGDWLIADDILQQVEDADVWSDPHSVVILAACESAGEDLVKMNGFVNAFAGARAGAVLGTEASVFESLARRFALSITASLIQGLTLGQAVLAFRRHLLQERNPLGLVFSAFGDADLHRARGIS